jgi:hypothetical protein
MNIHVNIWIHLNWILNDMYTRTLTYFLYHNIHREFGRRDLVVATAYFDFNSVQKCETDPIQVYTYVYVYLYILRSIYIYVYICIYV